MQIAVHNCYDITRFSVEFERPIFFSVSPQECILNQKVVLIITLAFFVISFNVSNSLLFSTAIFTVLNSFLASAVGLRIRQLTAILPNQKHFPNICVIFKSFSALMRALIIYLRTVVNVVFSLSLSLSHASGLLCRCQLRIACKHFACVRLEWNGKWQTFGPKTLK